MGSQNPLRNLKAAGRKKVRPAAFSFRFEIIQGVQQKVTICSPPPVECLDSCLLISLGGTVSRQRMVARF
jgi:hypothetical protein